MRETRLAGMKFIFESGVKNCVRPDKPKSGANKRKKRLTRCNSEDTRIRLKANGAFSVFRVRRSLLWFCPGPIEPGGSNRVPLPRDDAEKLLRWCPRRHYSPAKPRWVVRCVGSNTGPNRTDDAWSCLQDCIRTIAGRGDYLDISSGLGNGCLRGALKRGEKAVRLIGRALPEESKGTAHKGIIVCQHDGAGVHIRGGIPIVAQTRERHAR